MSSHPQKGLQGLLQPSSDNKTNYKTRDNFTSANKSNPLLAVIAASSKRTPWSWGNVLGVSCDYRKKFLQKMQTGEENVRNLYLCTL